MLILYGWAIWQRLLFSTTDQILCHINNSIYPCLLCQSWVSTWNFLISQKSNTTWNLCCKRILTGPATYDMFPYGSINILKMATFKVFLMLRAAQRPFQFLHCQDYIFCLTNINRSGDLTLFNKGKCSFSCLTHNKT